MAGSVRSRGVGTTARGWHLARVALAGLLTTAMSLQAQGLDPATPQRLIAPQSDDATAAARELAAAAAAAAEPAPVPRRPAVVVVRRVVVGPSAYLDPAELDEVARAIEAQRLTTAQLDQVTGAFDALYDARGIALAQTVVQRVNAATGTVEIAFVEARVDRVEVVGQLASPAHYRAQIGLNPGDLADTRILEDRLLRLALLSGVRSTVDFAPGREAGETSLTVTMEEPPRYQRTVTLDTHGSDTTGRYRVTLAFADLSLSGRLDRLGVSLTLAEGLASAALSYNRPLGPDGTQVFGLVTGETSRNLTGPAVTGRNVLAEIGLSRPLVLRPERQVFLRGSVFAFGEWRDTVGVPTTRQSGVGATLGGSIATETSGMSLSLDATLRVIGWRDDVLGLTGLTTGYLTMEGSALIPLGAGTGPLAVLRGGAQAVGGPDGATQFRGAVTSAQRVRGYPSGATSGDGYVWASVELRTRDGLDLGPGLRAQPFAFADIGQGWDRAGGVTTVQPVANSVGLGATLGIGAAGSGDVFVAAPLRTVGVTAPGDWRLEARFGLRF